MKKIYLSGATKYAENQGSEWRNAACILAEPGWECFNPNQHFDYGLKLPPTDKACMEVFLYQVKNSNVVLVNLENTIYSPGTLAELAYAKAFNVPIVGFGHKRTYSWAEEMCLDIEEDLTSAMDFIKNHL